jgi:hypothetical protein
LSKTTLIVVAVVVVIWFWSKRTTSITSNINRPVNQTSTGAAGIINSAVGAAPALGSFLGNFIKGFGGSSSSANTNDGGASFSGGVWGSSSAFADEPDFSGYTDA